MAETVITIVILLICGINFGVLGIIQYRSKEPVGFWSGKKPPSKEQISDIRTYNRKHGMMWIIYGSSLPIGYLIGVPFGEYASGISMLVVCIGGIVVMVITHNRIDRKYIEK